MVCRLDNMAATSEKRSDDGSDRNWTLHEMFRVIGDQLVPRDFRVLNFLYSGLFQESLNSKIKDGFTFFLALEKIGRVDESNFKCIKNALRMIARHDLIPFVTLRRRKPVEPDPVDLYLQETSRKKNEEVSCWKRKPPFFNLKPTEQKTSIDNHLNSEQIPVESKRSKGCLKRKGVSKLKGQESPEIPEKRRATCATTSCAAAAAAAAAASAPEPNRTVPVSANHSTGKECRTSCGPQSADGANASATNVGTVSDHGSVRGRHSVSTSPRRPANPVLSPSKDDSASSTYQETNSERLNAEYNISDQEASCSRDMNSQGYVCSRPKSPQPSTSAASTSPQPPSSSAAASSTSSSSSSSSSSSATPESSASSSSSSNKSPHKVPYNPVKGQTKESSPSVPKPATSSSNQNFTQHKKQLNDSNNSDSASWQADSDCRKRTTKNSRLDSQELSGCLECPGAGGSLNHGHKSSRAPASRHSTFAPKPKVCKATQTPPEQQQKQQQSQTLQSEIRKKVTCDIRLRVRAEYCHHESALQGNVFSNKPELLERQFEKFMQANTILKSRDLGSIICDIKFSELTYLDAFWRDYINGSLLEALKGVFITESLKQAVGHEAIKLLVNVDEDDYEAGRQLLLQNLRD